MTDGRETRRRREGAFNVCEGFRPAFIRMELEVWDLRDRFLCKIDVNERGTILDAKKEIAAKLEFLPVQQQSIRVVKGGPDVPDPTPLDTLDLFKEQRIYCKNLGRQISWRLVFLAEYLGPLFVYLLFALRPSFIYDAADTPYSSASRIACACWMVHYGKRVLETLFVHRFSHGTMPLRNLFKNCGYYWGFSGYVAYYLNHPLYTPPSAFQTMLGLNLFIICEMGNLSIHLLLRDLRPAGTTIRKVPRPNGNIMSGLFNFVSCPNYTYEFGSWLAFSIMTNSIPALMFSTAGMIQMCVWAVSKHRNYKREFKDYPAERTAIIPFIL